MIHENKSNNNDKTKMPNQIISILMLNSDKINNLVILFKEVNTLSTNYNFSNLYIFTVGI